MSYKNYEISAYELNQEKMRREECKDKPWMKGAFESKIKRLEEQTEAYYKNMLDNTVGDYYIEYIGNNNYWKFHAFRAIDLTKVKSGNRYLFMMDDELCAKAQELYSEENAMEKTRDMFIQQL